jgi:glycosyltransferase involved in cell wall biosynthesis
VQTNPRTFKVSVVLPAFNEAGNILAVCAKLQTILSQYSDYELVFVDDGSSDGTLDIIRELHAADARIGYLSFSRNFGHQQALKAGLEHADGDCVISLDCDLQHPPELIPQLIDKWLEGYDVVYTRRQDDPGVPLFKRVSSRAFYSLINKLSDVQIDPGAADFRLLDRKVAAVIKPLSDHFLFLRGLVAWLGFRQCAIPYLPGQRTWGHTKYSLGRMVRLAVNGVTSFSVRPLQLSTAIGAIISLLGLFYAGYAIFARLFTNRTVDGWTSVLVSVLLLGGIQLLTTGILGMYLGKLFVTSKSRPAYVVKETSREDASPALRRAA